MKKKITTRQQQTAAHIFDNQQWSQLNDTQKAKLLLRSERMLDIEIFLQEFKSLEQPEFDNIKSV